MHGLWILFVKASNCTRRHPINELAFASEKEPCIFIDCDHTRSIFNLAAYFVDLMRFVETNITHKNFCLGFPRAQAGIAKVSHRKKEKKGRRHWRRIPSHPELR